MDYAGQAKTQTFSDFLMHLIPTTMVDAFAKGDILEVVLVSILFGFALSSVGTLGKPLVEMLESLSKVVFRMVDIVMRFAPIEPSERWHSRSANMGCRRSAPC